ncbi:reverse transcriptase domain-containing protein [Tanacetum coccineum]|uniref:Reverse transcriptase domain-containing protein n=1 Tax=Tanacetum coccineum TaxID=301880 RepID=A0ABQ5EYC7_9ASTR
MNRRRFLVHSKYDGLQRAFVLFVFRVSLLTTALGFLLRVLAALIYLGFVRWGRPLKSILKKTTCSPHVNEAGDALNTGGSINDQPKSLGTVGKAAYNLRSSVINVDGRVLDVNGKPMKVRRKVAIVSNIDEEMAVAYTVGCENGDTDIDNATNATSGSHKMDDNCTNIAGHTEPSSNEDVSQATSGHGINDVGSDDGNKAADPKPMVDNHDTVLPKYAIDNVKKRYENPLVGFFVGKSLAFPIVQNYVNNTWGKFGLEKITRNDDGVFLFKFASKGGLDQVLERVAYSEDELSLIATQFKKPIMFDAFMSSMCSDSWGRISYARALIKISADTNLKKEVSMAIPIEDGEGYTREVISVEYEWRPPHYIDYKMFGHFLDTCPKTISEPAATMDNHGDGFTEVKSRKTNGKLADHKAKMSHISGIRINKPKPNFHRPKPAKENDHGKGASSMTKECGTNGSNNIKSRVNSFESLNSLYEDGNVDHIAKEVNEGLSCKSGSSRGVSGESNSMDGMDSFISSCGGDQDLEEDEVYDYDGYETRFGDQFDIRLKGCNRK